DIDANGILNVSAKDKATGKEQKIRIEASSGLSDAEIKRMRDEAKANEAADKAKKEMVDKINAADAMIFQSDKNLKDYGDKIPADKKSAIDTALSALREAYRAAKDEYDAGRTPDIARLDQASENLNNAWHAASEDMARAAQAGQGANPGAGFNPGAGNPGPDSSSDKGGGAEDVDFEEVK
ncbi:MAG: Hsp70 family protein, partial [Bacteroidales bacterium]|nr:Hsp70 family protein [Bacteroidales bacterium]